MHYIQAASVCYLTSQGHMFIRRAICFSGHADTEDVHEYAAKLGFQNVSEQIIDECKSTAVLYKHKKTGAEIMSVSNDDENKVFGIVFRTPP
jgi:hypothetical protein